MAKAFDKYEYYRRAVQAPEETAGFLRDLYREAYGRDPVSLREDFCGSGAVSVAWVASDGRHLAIAIDSDAKPQRYGQKQVPPGDAHRLQWIAADVLSARLPKAEIVCALNFSYCVFHARHELKKYFSSVRKSLGRKGLLLLDCFSGVDTTGTVEMVVDYGDFRYTWEQTSFDPLTRRGLFAIHIQRRGEKQRRNVFRYDWRLWTAPELRDLLMECGFSRIDVYTQGNPEDVQAIYLAARP